MTLYLNFRSSAVGGVVIGPRPWAGDGTAAAPALRLLRDAEFAQRALGKDVLFAAHGFNVDFENGARSLARLEAALDLDASEVFVGILWPGDFWLPFVNYPFEARRRSNAGTGSRTIAMRS